MITAMIPSSNRIHAVALPCPVAKCAAIVSAIVEIIRTRFLDIFPGFEYDFLEEVGGAFAPPWSLLLQQNRNRGDQSAQPAKQGSDPGQDFR